jgi:hypothetical protein
MDAYQTPLSRIDPLGWPDKAPFLALEAPGRVAAARVDLGAPRAVVPETPDIWRLRAIMARMRRESYIWRLWATMARMRRESSAGTLASYSGRVRYMNPCPCI